METLHRLAGVQDASDLSSSHGALPAQPVNTTSEHYPPPPLPKDSDPNNETSSVHTSHRASRASLPLNRKSSHRSIKSSRRNSAARRSTDINNLPADYPPTPRVEYKDFSGDQPANQPPVPAIPTGTTARQSVETARTDDNDDDFAWGPSHPCFPHPNPHCAPDSPEYLSTRVVRVRRDYLAAGDLYPQFANLYPEILDPLVSDQDFRSLITSANRMCKQAFEPCSQRAWIDALAGAFTGYVWDNLGLTQAKRGEKDLEAFMDMWNREREREGKEVKIIQLRRTGFMALDFVIPDPGIDMTAEEVRERDRDVTAV